MLLPTTRTRLQTLSSVVILAASPSAAVATQPVEAFPTNAPHSLTGACFYNGDLYGIGKGNLLIRYDPATGDQLEVVSPMIPGLIDYHFHSIASAPDGTFWVAEIHSRTFFQLRFSDYRVISSLDFEMEPGHPPFGLTFHNGHLWAGYHSDGPPTPVHGIHPQTGEVVAAIEFGAADVHGLVWAGGSLWALDNLVNDIVQVDAAGEVLATFALSTDTWSSLAYDGVRFWTTNLDTFFTVDLPVPPPGDLDGDGIVCVIDFLLLLEAWGPCAAPPDPCVADLDGDGSVGVTDFLQLLSNWGPCG